MDTPTLKFHVDTSGSLYVNNSTFNMKSVPDYDKYPCVVFAAQIYPDIQGFTTPVIYMNGAPEQVTLQLKQVDMARITYAHVYQYEPE